MTGQELEQLELASRASFHTVADQLRRGYLTMEGAPGGAVRYGGGPGRGAAGGCCPRRRSGWHGRRWGQPAGVTKAGPAGEGRFAAP